MGSYETIYDRQSFNRRMTAVMMIIFVLLLGIIGAGFDLMMNTEYGGGFRLTVHSVPLLILFAGTSMIFFFRKRAGLSPDDSLSDIDDIETIQAEYRWVVYLFLGCVALWLYFLLHRFMLTYRSIAAIDYSTRVLNVSPPGIHANSFFDAFTVDGIGIHYSYPCAVYVALVFGLVSAYWSDRYGSDAILRWLDVYPADPSNPKEKQLLNVAEEMSIAAGLPKPKTFIVWDDDPNAFTVGVTPGNSTIVVTQGLLNALERDELQGVIAHEMSHIKDRDDRLMSVVSILFGSVIFLASWARRGLFSGGFSLRLGMARIPLVLIWIVTILFARTAGLLIAMSISRNREYLADATAVELTRNPEGLIRALKKIEAASAPTVSCSEGVAAMCIIDPRGRRLNEKEGWWADLFGTHPPIRRRIMLLESIEYHQKS